MDKIAIALFAVLLFVGCDNFSPRMRRQNLNNENARINGLENNQNALKLELGRIANELGIQNSQIDEIQQGWANVKAHNENKGIQVFNGDGALILVFATITVGMLFYYMYQAERFRKATSIIAREIAKVQDPSLKRQILLAAENTEVESLIAKITQ